MGIAAGRFASGRLIAKLVLVLALSGLHGALGGTLRRRATEPARAVPAPLRHAAPLVVTGLLAIAILAVVKPF